MIALADSHWARVYSTRAVDSVPFWGPRMKECEYAITTPRDVAGSITRPSRIALPTELFTFWVILSMLGREMN